MEILQLFYFREIARDQNMTRTAERLNISQPALSKTLRNLERELGTPLFDRVGRGIVLNSVGAQFFEAVDRALNLLENAAEDLKSRSQENSGVSIVNLLPEHFTWFLDAFLQEYPSILLNETRLESTPEEALRNGTADLVLGCRSMLMPEFHEEAILTDELLLLLPPDSPETAETLDLEAVLKRPLISHNSDMGLPKSLTGLINRPAYQVSDLMMVIRLVEQGYGVALMPSFLWLQLQAKVQFLKRSGRAPKVIPIPNPEEPHQIYMTWSAIRRESGDLRACLNFCREHFRLQQGRLEQFRENGYEERPPVTPDH